MNPFITKYLYPVDKHQNTPDVVEHVIQAYDNV